MSSQRGQQRTIRVQASFDPPGLTVAVKKDRAVENLLNGGSKFVVNILAEGDHKALMKQLLKSFKPGEDRFAGLDIQARPLSCYSLDRMPFTSETSKSVASIMAAAVPQRRVACFL